MVPVKWSVGDNGLTPENIVDIHCMLQQGACVCAVVKQRPSRVPQPAISAGRVEDTVLIEEGQARSVGSQLHMEMGVQAKKNIQSKLTKAAKDLTETEK